jgi:hypothetical protein
MMIVLEVLFFILSGLSAIVAVIFWLHSNKQERTRRGWSRTISIASMFCSVFFFVSAILVYEKGKTANLKHELRYHRCMVLTIEEGKRLKGRAAYNYLKVNQSLCEEDKKGDL